MPFKHFFLGREPKETEAVKEIVLVIVNFFTIINNFTNIILLQYNKNN